MGIKAYVCVPLGVPNGKQGSMFTPVKVQVCNILYFINDIIYHYIYYKYNINIFKI